MQLPQLDLPCVVAAEPATAWHGAVLFADKGTRVPSSSGTENSAKAFSFLNTRSDFLTVAAVAALLATPSAALGDSVSSASVAALPIRGDDVLEDHGGSILRPRAGHSAPG